MLSGLVDGMDSFFIWLNSTLKQNLADYSDLETAQEEYTLVAKDSSLLSVIKIDGYRSLINTTAFFENISQPIAQGLDQFFIKPGHSMQIWFSMDPTKSERLVRDALGPSYETIKKLNLDLKEILDERVKNISSRANYEECYLVLWTRPAALVKHEIKQENTRKRKMRMGQIAPVKYSQDPFAGNGLLQNKHSSYVDNVEALLVEQVGISCKKLSVMEAARATRISIDDEYTPLNWEPFLPGDRIAPNIRHDQHKAEEWDIVWPKLSWQVCPRDASIIGNNMIQIGNKIYSPGYIDILPKDIQSFGTLFGSLGGKFPWRISFSIEGDGLSAVSTRGLFASILGFASGDNKLLNTGVRTLKEMKEEYNQTIVKIKIAFCTWGHKDRRPEVERQASELANAISGWGTCSVSEVTGDPIGGVMSSSLGATLNSVATISAAPLEAISFMSPFSRPSSAWNKGSVLFLSPDNKLMPYQPGSSEQTTWIQLLFAKPGSGKSVLMNVTNLALCLAPGIERLPRIGIVDIGPSSSGLISLLKESLPVEQRHLVQYYRIRMTEEYCINPFDTQLGCRFPTAEEKAFLNNFLLLLATDPNKEKPEDAMSGLVQAIIDDMYMKASEKGSPKRYDSGVDRKVDEALKESNMHFDAKTTWWEVVDHLFSNDFIHEAMLAQRHAVPLLSDASSSAQEDKIKDIYANVTVSTSETLVQYFNRSMNDALNQYRILGRPTVFDIGEARVVSLDLDEVAKSGGVQAERQTAVMYMLARYILGKDFKIGVETVNEMPYPPHMIIPKNIPTDRYKAFHKKKIENCKEDYKRLCFDEFHRTSKSAMVREQIIVDMREGRKWNLDVTLASQSIKDFDETMKSFATGIFIMDGGNERDIKELIDTFGVDDPAEQYYLSKGRVHGPRGGKPGVFMAKFLTNTGKYTQLLSAHIGSIEMWALSTTSEDAAIRSRLYEKIGPSEARILLAKYYPFGIKKVVEQRKEAMKNTGSYTDDDSNIYEQLVDEILKKAGYNKGY
jgi:intracellular multiplication protein IcmB